MPIDKRRACLETQRGCAYKCHFCYYNKGFNKIRFFSIQRVKKELAILLKKDLKGIYLMDPVFNFDLERAKEICRFIVQNNKKNIPFHTEIKAELVDEELAELLKKINVKHLEIGLQSTKDNVLHAVNRKLVREDFVRGVNLLKKHGLPTEIQLIYGLPEDTFESYKDSLRFLIDLDPDTLGSFRLNVLPGTEIRRRADEWDIIYEDTPPHFFLRTKSISFEESMELEKISLSLNLFRKKVAIKYLCKEAKIDLLDMIDLWIRWINDDRFLLNSQAIRKKVVENRFKKFLEHFCKESNIDYSFYDTLLKKEGLFSTKTEREQKMLSEEKEKDELVI